MIDRIGEFLLRVGAAGDARRFGEITVELGFIRGDAIKRYLDCLEKGQKP